MKDFEKFDTELPCISALKFVVRCAINGIHFPPVSAVSTKIYDEIPQRRSFTCYSEG